MGDSCTKLAQTMFSLIPKNVASERPIALQPSMIRWWEELRAPEVLRWQQKYRIEWDARDGRYGGAERTVCETLLGDGKIQLSGRRKYQGAISPRPGRDESFRVGQSSSGAGVGEEDSAGAMRVRRAPAESSG